MLSSIYSRNEFTRAGKEFWRYVVLILIAITIAYANHFENGFQFDDIHTISNNPAIRQIDIPKFFTDGSTFSALPTNQSYRPLITTVNAIDYNVRGGLYPGVFHAHIFLTFLLTVVLLVLFTRRLVQLTSAQDRAMGSADQVALAVGALFGLLCANAETVNYIIQRAEIEAGLYILAGFVAFLQGGIWRKWHLYMAFPLIGFFAKELAFMFAPLLFMYLLLFEENVRLTQLHQAREWQKLRVALKKVLPAVAISGIAAYFYAKALPETFSTGASDRWSYLITQPFVIAHYVLTFFLPYNLSADTDWTVFTSLADYRVWIGLIIILFLIWGLIKASAHPDTRIVSFGLSWFFLTLAPTSSIIPLAEVLNDHRCFIPYMGLSMAVVGGFAALLKHSKSNFLRALKSKLGWTLFILLLAANAWGVHERNKVWRDDLSLWKDVSEKSPKNGRGYMNYGLALMSRGQFDLAEVNFLRAAQLTPDYALVFVNLGILKQATAQYEDAEKYFDIALRTSTVDHQAHYYYAKYLIQVERLTEAKLQLEMALQRYPGYLEAYHLLYPILHQEEAWEDLEHATTRAKLFHPADPTTATYVEIATKRQPVDDMLIKSAVVGFTADHYLDLSLEMFKQGKYEACIIAAEQALRLKPDYPEAYNNIGIASVQLGHIEAGIKAYKKALELKPDFHLAKNNLGQALILLSQTSTNQ